MPASAPPSGATARWATRAASGWARSSTTSRWPCRRMEQADPRSAAAMYVPPEMTGVEDLDRYGRWQQHPEYGAVWSPSGVAVGLGALPLRPVGLAAALGLDLGGRRALGLRAVPLWPLAVVGRALVLGAGPEAWRGRCSRRRWSAGSAGRSSAWPSAADRCRRWVGCRLGPRDPYRPPYRASPGHVKRLNPHVPPGALPPPAFRQSRRARCRDGVAGGVAGAAPAGGRSRAARRRDGAAPAVAGRELPPQRAGAAAVRPPRDHSRAASRRPAGRALVPTAPGDGGRPRPPGDCDPMLPSCRFADAGRRRSRRPCRPRRPARGRFMAGRRPLRRAAHPARASAAAGGRATRTTRSPTAAASGSRHLRHRRPACAG